MNYPPDPFSSADDGVSDNATYLRNLKRANETPYAPISIAASEPKPPAEERRRNPRYKCEGSVEFRSDDLDVRTWATVTDLSRSGCYVEMQVTSPVDTRVNMILNVRGVRVNVKGVVRISYPFLGMGIAFTDIDDENRTRLDDLLSRLAGQSSFAGVVKPESSVHVRLGNVRDPLAALQAIADFFRTSPALTQEEFTELLITSQNQL